MDDAEIAGNLVRAVFDLYRVVANENLPPGQVVNPSDLMDAAAVEIKHLRSENKRLRLRLLNKDRS
jgi:hypothetical protein